MARLRLEFFGGFRARLGDAPVTGFESAKVRALLAYLAVEAGRPHHRETLLGLLWPDMPEDSARRNLRQALFNLRQALGDGQATPAYIHATRDTVRFDAEADFECDVLEFRQLAGLREAADPASTLGRAAALYTGPFLDQLILKDSPAFDEWLTLKREQFAQAALEALREVARLHESCGQFEAAVEATRRQLSIAPWLEDAHRRLMRLLERQGQRGAALAQYEACRRALAEQLGLEPEAETQVLYERLRAAEAGRQNNLPVYSQPFVGRVAERRDLAARLADPQQRVLVILGPGGMGKTRLAIQAAEDALEHFAHGCWFVSLVGIQAAEYVPLAVAGALSIQLGGQASPSEEILDQLRDRKLLLVLDNFEHLLEAADWVAEVARHAPGVKIIVTARERVSLPEALLVELAGLDVPDESGSGDVEGYSALQLFVQQARRARPGFSLAADRVHAVQFCRWVGGMPLAIELATAWLRVLSCREIVEEISRNYDRLALPAGDAPASLSDRHRSLRAVFEHSWNLLSAEEQRVFRQCAVFRGGFTREAAEPVAGASVRLLLSLIDKSLLRRRADGRYEVHELVRQFAEGLLPEAEAQSTRLRHARHFQALAEQSTVELKGPRQGDWLNRMTHEMGNFQAALDWCLQPANDALTLCAQLATRLGWFWYIRSHYAEGRDWLAKVLERGQDLEAGLRGKVANWAGNMAYGQGHFAAAREFYERGLAFIRQTGKELEAADVMKNLGNLAFHGGELEAARAMYTECLDVYRRLGDPSAVTGVLNNLAELCYCLDDQENATVYLEECLSFSRAANDFGALALHLAGLANIDARNGRFHTAEAYLQESLALSADLDDKWLATILYTSLGMLRYRQARWAEARKLYLDGLALKQELGNAWSIAVTLERLAEVDAAEALTAEPEARTPALNRAARLYGASDSLRQATGALMPPLERDDYEQNLARMLTMMNEVDLAAEREAGRQLTMEQALALARQALNHDQKAHPS